MDCSQCGTLVPEGQEICPACGGQVRKRSFWQRLLQFLSPGLVIRTKVEMKNITSIDKETGKVLTLKVDVKNITGQGVTKKVFSYRGPDGEKRTYHSLDEMPPDPRAQFKKAVASAPGVTEELFSYEGPDGQKHTYHSLEEMPPEIQAVFRDCLPPKIRARHSE